MAYAGMATGSAVAAENIARNERCRHAMPTELGAQISRRALLDGDTSETAVRETDNSYYSRAHANQLPGCAVRTVSPAMLSRKCSGRRRSHTAKDACTRAR